MPIKVIRISRLALGVNNHRSAIPKHNNLLKVNDALAKARNLVTMFGMTKRRTYQKMIIELSKTRYRDFMDSGAPISKNDIRRLECPGWGEIPVNIFDILEIIVGELAIEGAQEKNTFEYPNLKKCTVIISQHLIGNSIALILHLWNRIQQIEAGIPNGHPQMQNIRYRTEVRYILERLELFNERHPGYFSDLFPT